MNQQAMYDLTLNQTVHLIKTIGNKHTALVKGHMGIGKSTMLKILGAMLPTHKQVYFDCTTKDLMDLGVPKVVTHENGNEYVTFPTNEELGLHLDGPIILMFDEWGKATPGVKLGTLRVMLERVLGSRRLHPDSIVFATTNMEGEGVGDMLPAHARNRLTVVRMRKPTVEEWIEDFALNAGIHETMLAWALEHPYILQSFEDVTNPNPDADVKDGGNPHIHHPKAVGRGAVVTPRSMEAASDYMHLMSSMDETTFQAALVGTIGMRSAADLSAYIKISSEMPSLQDIKENPKTAKIPASPSAVVMVVMRTLNNLERGWMNAWMDYHERLDAEAQALFSLAVRSEKYKHREMVMTNARYTQWCLANQHIYSADKK